MAQLKIQEKEIEINFTEDYIANVFKEITKFQRENDQFKKTEQCTDENIIEYATKKFEFYSAFLINVIGMDNIKRIVGEDNELTISEVATLAADVCTALEKALPKQKNQPKFSFK